MTRSSTIRSRLRESCVALRQRCCRWFERNFAGAGQAVYIVSLAVVSVIWGIRIGDGLWPGWQGAVLFSLLLLPVVFLAGGLLNRLLSLVLKVGGRWLLGFGALACSTVYMVNSGAGGDYTVPIMVFSLASVLVLQLCAASLWALCQRRFTPTVLLSALCFGGLTAALAVFLFTDGFDDHYVDHYLKMGGLPATASLKLADGPFQAVSLDYGTEGALQLGEVDLTTYMSREDTDEPTELYLDLALDYDLNRVPLVGRIWYPEGETDCPALFIAHGNHGVSTDSYLGYDYLGRYLASHGYVVVSVDQNACNLLRYENDGRAVLLLEHMEAILALTKEKGSPLSDLIDPYRLVIAGHSRGGEMAATAYLFNGLDRYPENGNVEFDYHFNIRGIIAIAPTVNQYKPADHEVQLEDVNYLLLHGANDQDVTSFQGMSQYENISFTGEGDYLKSAVLIANANHGQFNSLWRDEDRAAPFSSLLNVENFLTQEEQENIARTFIKVFLDVTLLEDDRHRELLTNWERYRTSLPETVYIQCHETSDFQILADFEEDSDLETASADGVSLMAEGVNLWTEEQITYHNGANLDNYGVRLRAGSGIEYSLALPPTDLTGLSVRFDLSDYNSGAVERRRAKLLTGTVTVRDELGRESRAHISDFVTVWPPLPVRLSKLDYLFGDSEYKYAFSTVEIPADAFAGEADLANIRTIILSFDGTAHIRLDNIGLAGRPVQ